MLDWNIRWVVAFSLVAFPSIRWVVAFSLVGHGCRLTFWGKDGAAKDDETLEASKDSDDDEKKDDDKEDSSPIQKRFDLQ